MDESRNLTGMSKKVGERSVTRLASQALLLYFATYGKTFSRMRQTFSVIRIATDNQKERINRTCLNWREVTREEKYQAQTEEERDLVKALYRSSSMEQALP